MIESIEKEILGEKKSYYIMKMPIREMRVMIPINHAHGVGIRDVIDKSIADRVFRSLEGETEEQPANWNKRYRENMIKIKAEMYSMLPGSKASNNTGTTEGLSTGRRKMLNSAKQILISELVLAENMKPGEVEELINYKISL